jgi:hypothetical protein
MALVPSFEGLLQGFAVVMTTPSFQTFTWLVAGWVFASRRTITGMIVAAGVVGRKHHASFHRFFATARWSLDELGFVLLGLLQPWLGSVVLVVLDDTLARKRGGKTFGVGMHHDPLLSSRKTALTNWGHSWVILAVLVRVPLWPERVFAVPILFRLYLNHQAATRHRRTHRTRPELAVGLLQVLCQRFPQRQFHALADSTYGGQSVLTPLPANCDLTSRLLQNARLYAAVPPRRPGQKGRPRKRGPQLPTPAQLVRRQARRHTLQLYGRRDRVRLVDLVAYVYAAPERPLRVVVVDPLTGGRTRQAFYSTCVTATALQVLTWYAQRWAIEVAFHDSKQHLGFEEPQNWTRRAVERTAPIALLLYGWIVVWFGQVGHRDYHAPHRPWYTRKATPSFADMLVTLRQSSVRAEVLTFGLQGPGSRKIKKALETVVSRAG